MKTRLLAALVVAVLPFTASAAETEHPFKKVKVGEYVTMVMTTNFAGQKIEMSMMQTVKSVSEKEVELTVELKGSPVPLPPQTMKVDLTKPYDPTKSASLPGAEVSAEKLKEGTEKIKVNGKDYDCTWTTYKVTGKAMGAEVSGETKVWVAKDVPFGGTVKSEGKMAIKVGEMNIDIEQKMELKEFGRKSD